MQTEKFSGLCFLCFYLDHLCQLAREVRVGEEGEASQGLDDEESVLIRCIQPKILMYERYVFEFTNSV